MLEINKCIIEDINDFIDWFNRGIAMYGVIPVSDLKIFLGLEPKYADHKIGWTKEITVDNFVVIKKRFKFVFQLNLPIYKELY